MVEADSVATSPTVLVGNKPRVVVASGATKFDTVKAAMTLDEPAWELTTVSSTCAVLHFGDDVAVYDNLKPATDYELAGHAFRTLPDLGAVHSRIATVNDVHFGETECGRIDGDPIGPIIHRAPELEPYPELMNRAAIAEIAAAKPDAVIVKGDLTSSGNAAEYARFLAVYHDAFGDRLTHVRGNHDATAGERFAAFSTQVVDVDGGRVALLDTTTEGLPNGQVTDTQISWLDTIAAESDVPVLVMGHHHCWDPDSPQRNPSYFGIVPDDSEKLVAVAARHKRIRGYFAGHTHRNRRRTFRATGAMPWVEVASVKDFPGAWAEYLICEGGIMQLHHRISSPEALAWTNETRAMFAGSYAEYSFGDMSDRCFVIPERD